MIPFRTPGGARPPSAGWRALGLSVAALLLSAPVASAQGGLLLKPSAAASQEYDSNVILQPESRGAWVTMVDTGLLVERRAAFGRLRLEGGLNSRTIWKFREIDGLDYRGRYDLSMLLTESLGVSAVGGLERFEAIDELAVEGEAVRGGRPELDRGNVGAGIDYRFSPGGSLAWSIGYDDNRYGRERLELNRRFDRSSITTDLSYEHPLPSRESILLRLAYSRSEFTHPTLSPLSQDLVTGTASWTRSWTESVETEVKVGATHLAGRQEPLESGQTSEEDNEAFFVGGMAIKGSMPRTRLKLSFEQEVRPAGGTRGNRLVHSAIAQVDFMPLPRVGGRLIAGWRRFKELQSLQNTGLTFDIRSWTIEGELTWEIRRGLTLFAGASFADRDSVGSRALAEFDRSRARIGVRYALAEEL